MSERSMSAGARLRAAIEAERPLQIVGTVNACSALLVDADTGWGEAFNIKTWGST
jgi:2-methylisocitrate lyase-like PEP mutase family enzyme